MNQRQNNSITMFGRAPQNVRPQPITLPAKLLKPDQVEAEIKNNPVPGRN